jgi:hypothetical protein
MALTRAARVLRPVVRACRAARFAARVNVMAWRRGPWAAASARAARRSAARPCGGGLADLPARPAPGPRQAVAGRVLTTGSSGRWQALPGIGPGGAANGAFDGWTGADGARGPSGSRAAIPASRPAPLRLAEHSSRDRMIRVLLYRFSARVSATCSPCLVCAASNRAMPPASRGRLSGMRRPVQHPPAWWAPAASRCKGLMYVIARPTRAPRRCKLPRRSGDARPRASSRGPRPAG